MACPAQVAPEPHRAGLGHHRAAERCPHLLGCSTARHQEHTGHAPGLVTAHGPVSTRTVGPVRSDGGTGVVRVAGSPLPARGRSGNHEGVQSRPPPGDPPFLSGTWGLFHAGGVGARQNTLRGFASLGCPGLPRVRSPSHSPQGVMPSHHIATYVAGSPLQRPRRDLQCRDIAAQRSSMPDLLSPAGRCRPGDEPCTSSPGEPPEPSGVT